MAEKLKVCWLSAGVSSFVAAYLAKDVDMYIYIDIPNQHPDSMRFIKDCEKVLGKETIIIGSNRRVEEIIRERKWINSPHGAACTGALKKEVRNKWQQEHAEYDITYVWGFDLNEKHRADRMHETMPEYGHEFPLIENHLTKQDAHAILERLGIKRPVMYDMGYSNNNCIGCIKGGMGYWNKIRVDFPEVFDRMAKLEREIGASCINGIFLDELEPDRGRMAEEIMQDCSIFCYLSGAVKY